MPLRGVFTCKFFRWRTILHLNMEDINPIIFYTATILEWKHLLKNDKYKNIVIESLQFCVADIRVLIFGFVIMPNHIHLLWSMR
ncbi:MAG: hypothetical protein WCI97_09930, partial [Bacteroidota bacterium]